MNYYERHLGDYARDTAHLSMLEHGAYGLLLDRYYSTEQGIPADQAHRLARARTRDEKAAVDAVLAEFFRLVDGVWIKGRVQEEIERFLDGEPEREIKKANESLRMKRHREERALLFKIMTEAGHHAAWNIGINELRDLVKRLSATPATQTNTKPATALATPATATRLQTPDTRLQTPIGESTAQAPPASKRPRQSRMPDDFGVSDRVRHWATEKGYGHLAEHLDAFRRKVAANGYTAVSWDDKFMEAIREDWAKLRGRSGNGAAPPPEQTAPRGPDPELERLKRQRAEASPIPADIRAQIQAVTKGIPA